MGKLVLKKSNRKVVGSEGKPMKDVYYKGQYIDTISSPKELIPIKRMIDQQESMEKAMSKQRY